jgi:Uma2 family endonuclease
MMARWLTADTLTSFPHSVIAWHAGARMPTEMLVERFPDPIPPETPEVEILRGIELPKVSPKRRHGRLQGIFWEILDSWAGDDGEVSTEWRFWLTKAGEREQTTLVPDVAFVSIERMTPLSEEDAEEPPLAPDVAVEIRSPGDRHRNIQTKVEMYLSAGSRLVLDVDPEGRRIVAHDRNGTSIFDESLLFEHAEVPGLSFRVSDIFARSDRKRKQ